MLINTAREDKEWTLDAAELDEQIHSLLLSINRLEDPVVKRDLLKLYRNLEDKRSDISREAVRCRSLNRTTGTMQNLQKEMPEMIKAVEKWLTMALLMQE